VREAWRTTVRLVVARGGRVVSVGGRLPEVEVPGRYWYANLAKVVGAFEAVGIEPLVLRTLATSVDEAERRATIAVLAELRGHEPEGARWVEVDEVPDAAGLLAGAGPAQQPWADPEWLPAAETWLRSAVAASGAEVTGRVEQHKVWELSCVLRLPTTAGDVYFKSTVDSPLFVAEATVTAMLADLFPRHVPTPLAVEPERGWIATPDFGAELGWDASLPDKQAALRQYAELQQESVPRVDGLLAAGCLDRRPAWIRSQLAHWFAPETTRHWADPELAERLAAAVPRLGELCAELGASTLPDTLLHGDMHMANVARRPGGGYVFFDWTDAGISHPFVDMIAVAHEENEESRTVLRETYLDAWSGAADRELLDRDWLVAEVLAHVNQAISYMSLGFSLRKGRTEATHPMFASYTGKWLRDLADGLDRLGT
jgi:Phosphotransferase enzyme family